MVSSPGDDWKPVFPEPRPRHWVAFAHTHSGIASLSDLQIDEPDREWLATWLSRHRTREPDEEASYIFLGLGPDWRRLTPDGAVSTQGVTGLGSGMGFGEPADAEPSNVDAIVRLAYAYLTSRPPS